MFRENATNACKERIGSGCPAAKFIIAKTIKVICTPNTTNTCHKPPKTIPAKTGLIE